MTKRCISLKNEKPRCDFALEKRGTECEKHKFIVLLFSLKCGSHHESWRLHLILPVMLHLYCSAFRRKGYTVVPSDERAIL